LREAQVLTFADFSSSGERVLLARDKEVEVFNGRGAFQAGFQFSGPKQNIIFMDSVDQDRMLIVGDAEGNVWAGSPLRRAPGRPIVRQRALERKLLVSFQLGPSRKWGAMLFVEMKESGAGPNPAINRYGRAYVWKIGQFGSRNEDNRIGIPVRKSVISIAFQPGGSEDVVIAADDAGVVSLWSIENDEPRLRQNLKHDGHAVRYIGFSTDGKSMFTVADDKVLRTWPLGGAAIGRHAGPFLRR
jgi:WD40 repeat protein